MARYAAPANGGGVTEQNAPGHARMRARERSWESGPHRMFVRPQPGPPARGGSPAWHPTPSAVTRSSIGEMAERFKAPVLKTGEGSNLPWVRIPLSPPYVVANRRGAVTFRRAHRSSHLLSHTLCDGRPDDQCVSGLIAQRCARPCSAGGRAAGTCIAAIAFRTIRSEQRSPYYGSCTRLKRR